MAVAAPFVPSWEQGYTDGNVGGLLEAMLSPTGNFGTNYHRCLYLSFLINLVLSSHHRKIPHRFARRECRWQYCRHVVFLVTQRPGLSYRFLISYSRC